MGLHTSRTLSHEYVASARKLWLLLGAIGYEEEVRYNMRSINIVHTRWLAGLMKRLLVTLRENGGGRFVLSIGLVATYELRVVPTVDVRL